jgi:thiamine biosynthesis lipoprotein
MITKTRTDIMGMPITIKLVDANAKETDINALFDYFIEVDNRFSTYKKTSEISKINNGILPKSQVSPLMKEVFTLSEQTKKETNGYFNIEHNGMIDPSGLVKGWAVENARKLLEKKGIMNFYIDAGGDITMSGKNEAGKLWKVGIRNPFNREEIVKVIKVTDKGVATSGTYIRGFHIYQPEGVESDTINIVSLTVVGPTIYDADRFATAAFAMGEKGIYFLEQLKGYEGYMITKKGIATETSGFTHYVV